MNEKRVAYFPVLIFFLFQNDHARVRELSDLLISKINAKVEYVVRNGDPNGYPGCVNLSFSYVEGESLLMALKVKLYYQTGLGHQPDSRPGNCVIIWQRMHVSIS